MRIETIEIAFHTGTLNPCGIARATCLPRVLHVGNEGLSVQRALQKIKEALEAPDSEDLFTVAMSDLQDLIAAVR